MIRDTSTYKPFRNGNRTPSLKNLSARMLGVSVQEGEHSSVQDAQAAMRLYTMAKKDWEKEFGWRKAKTSATNRKSDSGGMVTQKKDSSSSSTLGLNHGNRLKYEDSDSD